MGSILSPNGPSDKPGAIQILDTPLQKVYLTSLHLAVMDDGASDQKTAFQKTWAQFAGPANVRTWENRNLFYYRDGVGFGQCALNEEELLTAENGSGQCGSWAHLLIGALSVNGIPASVVTVERADSGGGFAVKHFTCGNPSYPDDPTYRWKMTFNPSAIANGDVMVPKQPSDVYGDLTSLATLYGQNTAPPSEKVFARHFIVKVAICGVNLLYYDPSYGVTYSDAIDFESKAVAGYLEHFPEDATNEYRVWRPGGVVNIYFDR